MDLIQYSGLLTVRRLSPHFLPDLVNGWMRRSSYARNYYYSESGRRGVWRYLGGNTGIILQAEILFMGSISITVTLALHCLQTKNSITGIENVVRIENVLTDYKTY